MVKRVTSTDVAKRAGVSRSLVSAVLNGTPGITVSDGNRAAVLRAIKELNYTVNVQAKSMKTGISHCIGVFSHVYNALYLQFIEGIQQASGAAGYHVLLYGEGRNLQERDGLITLFRQGRIDGILTLDFPDPLDPQWEETVLESGIPFVTVEGIPRSERIITVRTDYREGVTRALHHMWKKTGLAPLYVNVLSQGKPVTQGDRKRKEAYLAWMAANGRQPEVLEIADEPWEESGPKWLAWLDRQKPPIAVLSNWSRGAVQLYRAAHERNLKIGQDIMLMAADNTERVSSHLVPSLSCIEIPYGDMGKQAFGLLLQGMENRSEPASGGSRFVPSVLYEGRSV